MLAIATPFEDFFTRGLVAGKHYWPINPARKCVAIKFAVDWGNAHPEQARRMGEEGSGFAREETGMDYVYEYMLHVLTQYSALLRYKPTVPEKAVELCAESMACPRRGRERECSHDGVEGEVCGRARAVHVAATVHCRGGKGNGR
uniref:Glycosyl transferase CAP10 domain-containing protein n=1 Tax=Hordeum vulgare subsp. vulgare TaxID=112509 RepID=A0A8I6YG61_HORVV